MTDDVIQAQLDAMWAAHEGDREPGISDLEWGEHSTRRAAPEMNAGPRASTRTDSYEMKEAA